MLKHCLSLSSNSLTPLPEAVACLLTLEPQVLSPCLLTYDPYSHVAHDGQEEKHTANDVCAAPGSKGQRQGRSLGVLIITP